MVGQPQQIELKISITPRVYHCPQERCYGLHQIGLDHASPNANRQCFPSRLNSFVMLHYSPSILQLAVRLDCSFKHLFYNANLLPDTVA
jgi:hypothetical protein